MIEEETVIYTYKTLEYILHPYDVDQKQWFEKSVLSAKKLGYRTAIFTDSREFCVGVPVDDIIIISDQSYVWDSYKIIALENKNYSNFLLSDNDVIFKKRINFSEDIDLYFDVIENEYSWNKVYKPTVERVDNLNIFSEKSYWNPNIKFCYNIGILKIINQELKTTFVAEWKDIEKKLKVHIGKFNFKLVTPFISQYILTLLSQNFKVKNFTKGGQPIGNEFYTHYVGKLKYFEKYYI